MKIRSLAVIFCLLLCTRAYSAENLSIGTMNDNFFENIVTDTLLLLDRELINIVINDIPHVAKNATFNIPKNSWRPRPSPKNRLANIYGSINSNNIKESFSSIVQPVVEMACTPQQQDPMNELSSKCISELFKYRIIDKLYFSYTYETEKPLEKQIESLSRLNDNNRYQQIIYVMADLMNSSFEKIRNKKIQVSRNILKYPLPIFVGLPSKEKESEGMFRRAVAGQEQAAIEREEKKAKDKAAKAAAAKQAARDSRPIINTTTGEALYPSGSGYVGSNDGTYYSPSGPNGLINTKTGEFLPTY